MKKCKVDETSDTFGKDVHEGTHVITYTVTDSAGLEAKCSFNILIALEGE